MTKKNLGRFMDLTTDFGFKTVFSEKNEELLLSFLNGIFEGRKVIVKINHLRLKQLGNSPEDRDAIFDLYCTDEDANHYIVEMQVAQQKNFMDRCLYYAAMAIQAQVPKGEWDYGLKPLYVISILNFNLWDDNTDCINHHSLMNEKTLTVSSDKLQLITVELQKFTKSIAEVGDSDLYKWLFCMKHQSEFLEQPAEIQGKIFNELFAITELNKLNKKDMETYELSEKRRYDYQLTVDYAEEKGLERGRMEGRMEGEKKGRHEGEKKGRYETTLFIAKQMRENGASLEFIVATTGLTPEQLKKI